MDNLKKLGIFVGLMCLLVACGDEDEKEQQRSHGLPPLYGMLCSADSTEFIAIMPHGTRLYKSSIGYKAYDNYQDAVKRAWELYYYTSPPPDTTNWQECN